MSKIYLIGGFDSFGVPYTRDNKKHISFLDILDKYLKSKKYDVTKIDMFSMSTPYNDADYLNTILDEKLTIGCIHTNQEKSIGICRKSGFFQFIKLPSKTTKLYRGLNEDIKDTPLTEIIKNNKVIFVYSCGANDFLKSMNTNLAELLSPRKLKEVLSDDNITREIAKVIEKIKNNIDRLISLNPNIEIYIMGVAVPTRVRYIRRALQDALKTYNIKLQELCNQYDNVHFVDNYGISNESTPLEKRHMAHVDWHPNRLGQDTMGNNLVKRVKT